MNMWPEWLSQDYMLMELSFGAVWVNISKRSYDTDSNVFFEIAALKTNLPILKNYIYKIY